MIVVAGDAAQYSAITSIGNRPAVSVEVKTRVPTSEFDFEAAGASIAISGSVTVKFAGRRLSIDMDRLLQANNEEETAEFNTIVQLAGEPGLAPEGEDAMMNPAKAITAGKVFAILGMAVASAFALW